jgi:signal transduction histidine kinase
MAVSNTRTPRWRLGDGRTLVALDIGLAVVVMATLVVAAGVAHDVSHVGPLGATVRYAALSVAASAIPLRRFHPFAALVVATVSAVAVTAFGGPAHVVVCSALAAYSVATASSPRQRFGTSRAWFSLATPFGVGIVVAAGIGIGRTSSWLAALVAAVAVIGVGWTAGEATKERRNRIVATAERRAEQERQRVAEIRQAAADERLEIARELHDIVAHAMSLIAVRAGVARVVMDSDPVEVKEALGIIETTTRRALQEMRLLVGVLRRGDATGADLAPVPGMADVAGLVAQFCEAGVAVRATQEGRARTLPAGVELSAYRIIQEALTNVVRHAGPTRASLRIEYRPDELVIELTDSGPEPNRVHPRRGIHAGTGHGLIGMAERVALFDGHLESGPAPPGFRVKATLRTDEGPQ